MERRTTGSADAAYAMIHVAALAAAVAVVSAPLSALALDPPARSNPASAAVLDYAKQQSMKKELMGRIVLVEVTPTPGPFEKASLVARRQGEGIPLLFEGRPAILTSYFLTTGAASIDVSTFDGLTVARSSLIEEIPEAGLAVLSIPGPIQAVLASGTAEPGDLSEVDTRRLLFCVLPVAAGMQVITNTVVTEKAGPPLSGLFVVPGRFPAGTVFFDAEGSPVAVAARESWSGNAFTLVAPLKRPAKPQPVKSDLLEKKHEDQKQ